MPIKPRIAIRAHTARRDTASSVLIERALQRKGYDTFICSVRNFEWILKYWKPDAVVVQTTGSAIPARRLSPDAALIFMDAEGLQPEDNTWATFWSQNPDYYDVLDLAMIWGPMLVEEVKRLMPDADAGKLRVTGSPKFDLVRHVAAHRRPENPPKSVGIVGRYPSINNHDGFPTIRGLHVKSNLDFTISSCNAYHVQHQIIRDLLLTTDYTISIRPHPLEDISSYYRYVIPSFGKQYASRFVIDDRLDVADWMIEQRALISPTSTAYIEAYVLGIPFIIVDRISGMYDYNAKYADVCREWLESAYVPHTIEEASSLVKNAPDLNTQRPMMDRQLQRYCGLPGNTWATTKIVDEIDALMRKRGVTPSAWRMPSLGADLLDQALFWRAQYRDPRHANFHYRRGYHLAPEYVDATLDEMGMSRQAVAS